MNWDIDAGAPSFGTDPPSDEIQRDPSRLEVFKDYVRNIADWLSTPTAGGIHPRVDGEHSGAVPQRETAVKEEAP